MGFALAKWLATLRFFVHCNMSRDASGEKPQFRVLKTYSHSLSLVCRRAIPVASSWVVGLDHLAAESLHVLPRERLGQNMGQRSKLFGSRGPAVSFLSQGHKQTEFQVTDILVESANSLFQPPLFLFRGRNRS